MSIRNEKQIYDTEHKRFVKLFYPVVGVLGMTIVFFVLGLFYDMGTLILMSFFAFTIAAITLVHDHWILNSLTIPFGFLFALASISDFAISNWGPAVFHGIIAAFSITAFFTRKSVSFIIMALSSFIYAMWIFTIFEWTNNPYYGTLFGVTVNAGMTFFIVLISGLATAVIRAYCTMVLIKKGEKLDCDGGYCPL